MKNIILVDFRTPEAWSFLQSMNRYSTNWHCKACITNKWNKGLKNSFRYALYFLFPLRLLFGRKKYGCIIAWQQFYGLNFAFWSRLFGLKKRNRLVILTFIYKKRGTRSGRLYHKYMRYIVTSRHVDMIISYSSQETAYYRTLFPEAGHKFRYVPLGIDRLDSDTPPATSDYIFTTGRSNRDYDFLIRALSNTKYPLKIACDCIPAKNRAANVEILSNCYGKEMIDRLKGCYCVCIALDDIHISAGQLVILQAMQLGKPIIVTESFGITDYVVDGYNGYIIEKDKTELLAALDRLYENKELYDMLSRNCVTSYNRNHSIESLARNIVDMLRKPVLAGH